MFCRKCGAEIRPGAKFCVKCGTPVAAPKAVVPMEEEAKTDLPKIEMPEEELPKIEMPEEESVKISLEKAVEEEKLPEIEMPEEDPSVENSHMEISQPQQQAQPQMRSQVQPQQQAQSQMQQQNYNAGYTDNSKNNHTGGGKGIIIALVCIIILLLGAGTAMFIYFNGQSSRPETEDVREEERDTLDEADDDRDQEAEDDAKKETESTGQSAETEQAVSTELAQAATEVEDESQKIHTYQIVTADVTWTQAYQAAKNVPNGHLVNIDTEEEWNTIINQIKEQGYEDRIFWIGAMRRGDSNEYYWVDADGKNVGNTINESSHWLPGEPTFYDSENNLEERYVDMFHSSAQDAWVWNDTPDDLISLISYYSGKIAYIVEIED